MTLPLALARCFTDVSYYKERQKLCMGKLEARKAGLILTLGEERAMGLRPTVVQLQPTAQLSGHLRASDKAWMRTLLDSGLDLDQLDHAMRANSSGRLDKLTSPILSSTPEPGSKAESILKELEKLTCGKSGVCSRSKFINLKPIYWQMREASTSK